ncbi:hypothetical protein M409DRAFT_26668 [Zasmidium cellare ATCC 36951]|uniref:Uncharacterized protein n=1 Tax=Zasmidium cellare ATCC 36951 TaxID=1080233 RepID=A0A6A6C7I7_ZASCE|nr:uncharacterized protein M409DRAFT_26668 [Zasmidium cellare ATCC 36951]KAF2162813.1 hypothetical protein M409DRAFT_26668 [Zasmidium cellare ATCC 36951]
MSGNLTNSQITQVRTFQPLTINTIPHSPSTGNRTFLLSPSPTTSTDSYRAWMGTTDVAAELRGSLPSPTTPLFPTSSNGFHRSSNGTGEVPSQLRTLSGLPWQIPGDSGAGYVGPDLDNDSSLSSIPTGSSTDVSHSTLASSTTTITPSSTTSRCCCALRPLLTHALRSTTTRLRNTFTHHTPPPPPTPHHPPTSIETSLLQIHLHTLHTTPLRFLHWSFGYFSLHRAGSNARVRFPEEHYAHLPIRAVVLLVAMDLEEGALWVEGDGVEGDVAWSLGVVEIG